MSKHLPLVLLIVLMGLALWPLPQILWTTHALGHPSGDLADHVHGAWWFGGELLSGRWPSTSAYTHYPESPALWYIDPIGGLLAGVLFRPLGAAAAWNMAVLTQLAVAAVVAWRMGRDLLESDEAAVVLALTVTCSAPILGFLHSGLGEYLGLAPATGLIWASLRAMGRDPRGRPPSRQAALWMGACLALCTLQTPYYGVFGGLWLVCMLLGTGWRSRTRPLGIASAVAAIPVILIAWAIQQSLSRSDAAIRAETAPGWSPSSLPATDLLSFLHPGPWYHPDTPAMGNPGILHISYIGLGALLLLVCRFRWAPGRRLGLGLPTLMFSLLCLGPVVSIHRWSPGVPLPMALLFAVDSPLRGLHHPYRIIGLALPLLGLWLAWVTTTLPRRFQLGIPVLLIAETLYLSPAPWPLQTLDTRAPEIYAALPSGPVLDWPADASTWNRRYLVWQTEHERPVAVGVNVFITPTLRRDPLVGALTDDLEDLASRARNRDVPFRGSLEFRGARDARGLRDLGYESLVLHLEALSDQEADEALETIEATLGAPDYRSSTTLAWDL